MSMRTCWTLAGSALLLAWAYATPAEALTMHECSVKYKAAKSAGALNGMKWRDFRKSECGADAAAAPDTSVTTGTAATAAPPSRGTAGSVFAPSASPSFAPAGNAVFPATVSPKYASESTGRARMHTCLDQYRANKVANGNGGLKWIQKGGGYYSECNKRLGGR